MRIRLNDQLLAWRLSFGAMVCATLLAVASPVSAQRLLGLDVSAYQGEITQAEWDTFKRPTNQQVGGILGDGRDFVIIRSSRGGTTGEDHRQGAYPAGNNSFFSQSERYDDPYFVQNITRATEAGLFAGAYHFARPDVIVGTVNSNGSTVTIANTGADEADHFIQMAGPWMRPGYLPPMYDFEAGQSQRTPEQMAQFSLDFSNRIYQVMGVEPSIYSNGSYNGTLASASAPLRDQIAQPAADTPSVVSPAYPTLVIARWPNQANPGAIDVQNAHPKDSFTPIYGPWDDYGTTHPWDFWQYSSTMKLNGNNSGTANTDVDVSQGDIESVKDHLIPAVWMNNSSGDWSTLLNWNSGQPAIQPPIMSGQLTPLATGPLPAARLPGAAGSGPTAGSNDTVILERPDANITVTLSTGTHNIRKMYMREALNITGGTLTINYDPNYVSDTVNYPNALRSGPISAQFSGPVSLSGSGSLSVNTVQVDALQTFTLAGGTLTFNTINLMPSSVTPARLYMTGDVTINPLNNATATIAYGSGLGDSGAFELNGARTITVGNGSANVDLNVAVALKSGGLIKSGAGTMQLSGDIEGLGPITVNAGVLRINTSMGVSSNYPITINNGGTFDMNGISDGIYSLDGNGGSVLQGSAALTFTANFGSHTFAGNISGTGTLGKYGFNFGQTLSGNNSLGPVMVNEGRLYFNGTNSTGAVTVNNSGTLGGNGSISGAVTVNSGGDVFPGGGVIESFDVGALTLNAGSRFDVVIGAPGTSGVINIGGLLTLNGGLVVLYDDLGITDVGTYTIMTYGTISGSVANLGAPDAQYALSNNFNYKLIDTGSSISVVVTLPGDFNLDSKVDEADYVSWRKNGGVPGDYDLWRANFGRAAGSGSGLGDTTSVPEPATILLLVGATLPFLNCRIRRGDQRRGAKRTF